MRLTLSDVLTALNGLPGEAGKDRACHAPMPRGAKLAFTGISTDTRTLQPGDLFVALIGKATNGHEFVPHALRAGAAGLIVSQEVVASRDIPIIRVPDTEVAYGLLARYWRDRFDIPVIGVTGSVGKTTVKEMLTAALSPLGPILKTAASQNNETGVPKALLQLRPDHKAAVIEMGMRGRGQIAYLCSVARPTIGVITVISDNHIELLGSREAIADAKGELLDALPEDGLAVLNADDPYYERLRAKTNARIITVSPSPSPPGLGTGRTSRIDHHADDSVRTETGWRFLVRDTPVQVASPSRHDIANALTALAVAEALGVPLKNAAHALQSYEAPPMRMQVIKTGWGGTILNDAYNAAPASARSALETLQQYAEGRRIAFLGDMKELGDHAVQAHQELGQAIAERGGLDALYTVGALAERIPGAAKRFADSRDAARFAQENLDVQVGDVVLVKGSRAMAMEKVVEALMVRRASPPRPSLAGKESAGFGDSEAAHGN